MFRTRTAFAATLLITACRTAKSPNEGLQPIVTAPANDTSIRADGPWALTPSNQPHTYLSISQTTIHESSDQAIQQTRIELTTVFTISLNQARTPFAIFGHIDTVKFSPENQLPPNNNPLTLPLLFEGQLLPTGLRITVKNPQFPDSPCSPLVSSILSDLHAAVVTYPMHLAPGFTWRDSTLITTCIPGGIPTTTRTVQSFRVIGESVFNLRRALLIQRMDSTYIHGDGPEGNHQIHLEGIGTGSANIYISPVITFTLGIELSEKTNIAITNSGKTHHFIQEVTQKLKATN